MHKRVGERRGQPRLAYIGILLTLIFITQIGWMACTFLGTDAVRSDFFGQANGRHVASYGAPAGQVWAAKDTQAVEQGRIEQEGTVNASAALSSEVTETHNPALTKKFTLITSVFTHPHRLRYFIGNYTRLPKLDSIVVVWNCINLNPPLASSYNATVPVHIHVPSENSMNNRFIPHEYIKTAGILLLDDDLRVSHRHIARAFTMWSENPKRLVGFLPRSYSGKRVGQYQYNYLLDSRHTYSMILIGASFFHVDYMHQYWSHEYTAMRQYVDRVFNCDDVLMNMIIAKYTGKPPIQVWGHVASHMDMARHSGLSEKPDWIVKRHNCMNDLARLFGCMPLKENRYAYLIAEQDYSVVPFVDKTPN
eukprot:comp23033_c0_seq1/m.36826 comp23033_c0_seq1/g.36826  ORF comp23033_c0_seq1/g.36826 comp23033_c0_seq1/m.36826 type:complete len:364 (-) comp23033_c0_seq1:614-1705(-)